MLKANRIRLNFFLHDFLGESGLGHDLDLRFRRQQRLIILVFIIGVGKVVVCTFDC